MCDKKPIYFTANCLNLNLNQPQEKNIFSNKLIHLLTENEDKSNAKHIHGFRFIEIETGYVAKPNQTAISALSDTCNKVIKTQTNK